MIAPVNSDLERPGLVRALGLFSAFCVVAGSVIGTGVFLVASDISKAVPSPALSIAVWGVAGLFSLVGGLIFAELGAMFPGAGGQYVYFREALGPTWGFLFSWTHTLILCPGTLAALAVGSAVFVSTLMPLSPAGQSALASFFLIAFTVANLFGVKRAASLLDALTSIKLVVLAAIVLGSFFVAHVAPAEAGAGLGFPGFAPFGVALIAAFWAFDGWQGLSQVAGEIRDPQRNLPRASALGVGAVLVLYVLVHWTYTRLLPLQAIQGSASVGMDAARVMWGGAGARLLSAAILVSSLGCLNATVLTGARVTYAAAVDGSFPRPLAYLHPEYRVPWTALLFQMLWSTVLVWSGSYDQLFTYVVCAAFVFYALTAFVLMRLRRLRPDASRPFRLPAYPVLPLLYLVGTSAFVLNTFRERPRESMIGFVIVALGVPAAWLMRERGLQPSRRGKATQAPAQEGP